MRLLIVVNHDQIRIDAMHSCRCSRYQCFWIDSRHHVIIDHQQKVTGAIIAVVLNSVMDRQNLATCGHVSGVCNDAQIFQHSNDSFWKRTPWNLGQVRTARSRRQSAAQQCVWTAATPNVSRENPPTGLSWKRKAGRIGPPLDCVANGLACQAELCRGSHMRLRTERRALYALS